MLTSSLVSLIDRQKVGENIKILQKEVFSLVSFIRTKYNKNHFQGFVITLLLTFSLLGAFFVGSKLSNIYFVPSFTQKNTTQANQLRFSTYIPSNGIGQETTTTTIKNDGKKIIRDWIDIFRKIFNSFDPLFKDFLNLTPQYITANGSDISFTTGTVKSAKPIFDIFMGISTSLIVLFLTLESLKVIAGSAGSLKEVGKKYLIGFILLLISGWIISLSIDLANAFTQDVIGLTGTNGQSILSEYTNKYLDNLKLDYQDSSSNIFQAILGLNTSNALEILQAYFQTFIILFPSIIITILFLLIIIQMAWRWAMLYLLAPFAPIAQVFYLAPFKNDITKNYWNTWTTNLIHLPIFLVCYKIFHEGFLANQTTTSAPQILIFIVFLFILWQVNSQIGRIFGDIGVIMSNSFSNNVLTGLAVATTAKSLKMGGKTIIGGAKILGGGVSSGYRKVTNKPKSSSLQYRNTVSKNNVKTFNNKESKLLSKALKTSKRKSVI